MALVDSTWYANYGDGSTTGYYAVAKRPQNTAVVAGQLCRQFTAPSVNNERVFICIVAGTTANTTDATWTLTRGAKITDGTATWQECTGQASLNGDLTNTSTWAQVKAATPAVLGQIIKRSSNASYQICTTAGAMSASEPAFSDTAGVTTTDTTAVWTSLGPVSNFTGGQAPHARIAAAFTSTWFASGSTIYVGDNHAETTGSNVAWTGNSALMAKVLCHNHSSTYPPAASDLMTGASVTAAGATNMQFQGQGAFYIRGIKFETTGDSTIFLQPALASWYYFDACSFWLRGTSSSWLSLGAGSPHSNVVTFNNTTLKFTVGTAVAYIIPVLVDFTWQNTGAILESGSQIPVNLFNITATGGGRHNQINLEGLDLSQLTGSLFTNTALASIGSLTVQDCKLNASMTVTTPGNTGMVVQLNRCSSGSASYTSSRYAYEGTETTETTITRVGGAVDPTGQAQSRKIVTTANAQWLRPFKAEPYAIWNATTGSNVTVTIYGTINSGSLPLNDEMFMEVEYLGDSSFPLGETVTTTKATVLTTGTSVSSDGSTWNGGGSGGGWSPFKLTTTLSSPQPAMAGYLNVRVRAAKASTTYYIDPKIELT